MKCKCFINQSFNLLFLLSFLYLLIGVALHVANTSTIITSIIYILLIVGVLILSHFQKNNDKIFYLISFACTLFVLLVQLYVCTNNIIIPKTGDFEAIYTGIKELVNYGTFTDSEAYFLAYPHQLFSTFCFAVLNRVFVILGSPEPVNVLMTTYSISILNSIGLFCGAIAAKKLFGNKQAYITLLLLCLYTNNYSSSVSLYPHAIALAVLGPTFLIISIALTNNKTKISTALLFVLSGVAFAIAQSTEGIFAIGFIAFIIFIVIHYKSYDALIKAFGVIIGFCITLVCITYIYNALNIFTTADRHNRKLPYEHWIMIGLSEGGDYNEDDYTFSIELPDTKTRQEEARKVILKRLESRSFTELIAHLHEKEMRNWSSAEYGTTLLPNVNGNIFVNAFSVVLLLGAVILAINRILKKRSEHCTVFQIWGVGIFLFFVIWESGQIYLVSSILVICFIAASGFSQIDFTKIYFKVKNLMHQHPSK